MSKLLDFAPATGGSGFSETDARVKEDLRGAVVDWFNGAKAGIKEVERAAANLGANATPEQIRERIETNAFDDSVEDTSEAEKVSMGWYEKSTRAFRNETVQPIAMGAAIPMGAYGLTVMAPFLIDQTSEEIEKNGLAKGTFNSVMNLVPVAGTAYQYATDQNYRDFVEQHPSRAFVGGVMDAADVLSPAMDIARRVRADSLVKEGLSPVEAEAKVRGEFDLNAPEVQEKAKATKTENKEPLKKNKKKKKKRKVTDYSKREEPLSDYEPQKFTKVEEQLDPLENSKVSEDIDRIIEEDISKRASQEKDYQEFKGAFNTNVKIVPPRDPSMQVSLEDIWRTADSIEHVRMGHMGTKKGVLGYYMPSSGGIRLKDGLSNSGFGNIHDFSIVTHELGHALFTKVSELLRNKDGDIEMPQSLQEELTRGVKTGRLKNSPYKGNEWIFEGTAEFMATYIADTDAARQFFPQYSKLFDTYMQKNPELASKIDLLAQQVRAFDHQNATAKLFGTMSFENPEPSLKDKIVDAAHSLYTAFVDDTHDLERVLEDSGVKKVSPTVAKNIMRLAREVKSTTNGRINALLGNLGDNISIEASTSILERVFNTKLHRMNLKKAMEPLAKISAALENPEAFQNNIDVLTKELNGLKGDFEEAKRNIKPLEEGIKEAKVKGYSIPPEDLQDYHRYKTAINLYNEKAKQLTLFEGIAKHTDSLKAYMAKHKAKDWHQAYATFAAGLHLREVYDKFRSVATEEALKKLNATSEKRREIQAQYDLKVKEQEATIEWLKEASKGGNIQVEAIQAQIKAQQQELEAIYKIIEKYNKAVDTLAEQHTRLQNDTDAAYRMPADFNVYTEALNEAPVEFYAVARNMSLLNDNMLRIAVSGEILSAKLYAKFRAEYPNYVPLERSFVIEKFGLDKQSFGSGSKGTYANIDAFYRRLNETGSRRSIKDPMLAMVNQLQTVISDVERNKVGKSMAEYSKREGNATLMMPVGDKKTSSAQQIFHVWENGEKVAYQATFPGVYEAMTSMTPIQAKWWSKYVRNILSVPATILRIGATMTPSFAIANGWRDSFFSALKSDGIHGANLVEDARKRVIHTATVVPKGVLEMSKGLDEYMDAAYYISGAGYTTRMYNDSALTMLRDFSGKLPDKYKDNPLYKGVAKIGDYMDRVEKAPRYAEFANSINDAGGIDRAYSVAISMSAERARNNTVDFSQAGKFGREWNSVSTFLNASIQGTRNALKLLKEHPARTMAAGAATLTIPTIALWAINRDKEWYRDLPLNEKMRFWHFEDPITHNVIKLPRVEFFGYLFAALPELMLNSIDGDTKALEGSVLAEMVSDTLLPNNLIPTGIRPFIEGTFNRDFFRHRDLVPASLREGTPEVEQYTVYTSEVAKGTSYALNYISKMIPFSGEHGAEILHISPIKIDNGIKSITGSMGQVTLNLIDDIFKDNKAPSRPFVKQSRFVWDTEAQSRTADVYYEAVEHYKKYKNSSKKETAIYKKIEETNKKINPLYKKIKEITNNEKLSGLEKNRQITKKKEEIRRHMRDFNRHYLGYKYIRNVN